MACRVSMGLVGRLYSSDRGVTLLGVNWELCRTGVVWHAGCPGSSWWGAALEMGPYIAASTGRSVPVLRACMACTILALFMCHRACVPVHTRGSHCCTYKQAAACWAFEFTS